MPQTLVGKRIGSSDVITAVGIDVGGEHKGFHAVAITGGGYLSHKAFKNVTDVLDWCRNTVHAKIIAVDAPCGWSHDGHSRPAERQLMQKGIWCFSTPTRAKAVGHPKNYYGWMLNGEKLFQALANDFPICRTLPTAGQICSFETFPHAITWHLRGGNADASQKRAQRRDLLVQAEIDLTQLTNIDLVDAALCALTACYAAIGRKCMAFGEPATGLIIVPACQNS